jgi:hypothetical protein
MNEKRYTNQTFTRRVDHDGGTHRPRQKMKGAAHCAACGAVYSNGKWSSKEAAGAGAVEAAGLKPTICPGCYQVENELPGGYLNVTGSFLREHNAEVSNLIANEVREAQDENPLSQVVKQEESDGKMVVETTTEHLAQRLGHALKRAYAGAVTYDFSHENKVVRVSWHRD